MRITPLTSLSMGTRMTPGSDPRDPDLEDLYQEKLKKRFASKCSPSRDGCLIWTGSTDDEGYGKISYKNRNRRASHVAWRIKHGRLPHPDKFMCHNCDNPVCVNVDHLYEGTHQENVDDKMRKGRHRNGARRSEATGTPSRAPLGHKQKD